MTIYIYFFFLITGQELLFNLKKKYTHKKNLNKSEASYRQLIINRSHLKDYLIESAMHLHKSSPNKKKKKIQSQQNWI